MTRPERQTTGSKTCNFWDCQKRIIPWYTYCSDHNRRSKDGEIDKCPECMRGKYATYSTCLDCKRVSEVSEQDQTLGYTLRDCEGDTVYVGITKDPFSRVTDHKRDGKEFETLTVETKPMDRREAEDWETHLIKCYKFLTGRNPIYNKTPDGKWHFRR